MTKQIKVPEDIAQCIRMYYLLPALAFSIDINCTIFVGMIFCTHKKFHIRLFHSMIHVQPLQRYLYKQNHNLIFRIMLQN